MSTSEALSGDYTDPYIVPLLRQQPKEASIPEDCRPIVLFLEPLCRSETSDWSLSVVPLCQTNSLLFLYCARPGYVAIACVEC
jgi:hypothetical protein